MTQLGLQVLLGGPLRIVMTLPVVELTTTVTLFTGSKYCVVFGREPGLGLPVNMVFVTTDGGIPRPCVRSNACPEKGTPPNSPGEFVPGRISIGLRVVPTCGLAGGSVGPIRGNRGITGAPLGRR